MDISKKDRREYYKQYYQKNKAYWFRKFRCNICGGRYLVSNRYKHRNTLKHKKHLEINNYNNEKTDLKLEFV